MATDEALKNLDRWAAEIPKLLQKAVIFTMFQAEQEAKRTTAFHDRTGRLRNSIQGGLVSIQSKHIVGGLTAGKNDANPGRGAEWATASMEYAPYVELGTARMSPRPFLWPATQAVRNKRILERAVESLAARIRL